MQIFDSRTIELAGRNLIEASAGTGKTYAIASLYVRLLVEKGLLPENILVVTFTEAATKELRDRIRRRIRDARDAFLGRESGDKLLPGLLQRERPIPVVLALERLEAALQTFDCAAISTIHGFCNRALQENAFESGSLYDSELTSDQSLLVQGLVDDYWRINFFGAEGELLPLAEAKSWSPEGLARFLKGKLGNPELEVIPRYSADQVARVVSGCREAFAEVAQQWLARRQEIVGILTEHKGLSRSAANYHPDLLEELLERMDAYVGGGRPFQLFDGFAKFSSAYLAGQRLKKHDPPQDVFFDACQGLADAIEERGLTLLWGLFEFVRERLPQKKSARNIRFHDDLLVDLYRALQGPGGELLAGRIRGRYRAGLIDEFQDTDQVQYRIFRGIFNDDTIPLFLIGDPKQAIYSFRGADIFAYLKAKRDIPDERHFTMDRNWRSAAPLVEAINRLFNCQKKRPLLFEELEYPPVTAANGQALVLAERDPAALQLWFMGREEGTTKPIDMNRARPRIVAAVVAEIAGLLADGAAGRATIADRAVRPGDIAVIVRSHGQAGLVYEQLVAAGIPAVVRSNASIFASDEAAQLCRLLAALAEPGREGRVRNALVTTIMGATGNQLAALLEEAGESDWEGWLARFREYHDIWRLRGFMAMFRTLVLQEGVRGRLLSLPGGERRLTNLLHCGELLHGQEGTARLGMEALLTWFSEQVASPPEGEEHQLRLESDEEAVRILTIHVSKGLEFPIVFCPFSWSGVFDDDQTVVCHQEGKTVADYGSRQFEQHRRQALEESLAENLRLLYVALTRAKYRCYLVWGRFKHVESSALAYLLHGPGEGECGDLLAYLARQMKDLPDACLLQALAGLEGKQEMLAVTLDPQPVAGQFQAPAGDGRLLTCRTIERSIEVDWHVSSFTSFVEGQAETAELPDHDRQTAVEAGQPESIPAEGSLFAFPRGAKAGTFLHGILEKVDFSELAGESLTGLVAAELARSGFGSEWHATLCEMLRQVLAAPLGRAGERFRLSELAKNSWVSEMEFYFPLKLIGSRRLAALLKQHGAGSPADLARVAERLNFREVAGMLRGFIDLVFCHQGKYYLLDWKSNHLGNRIEEYGSEQLAREMEAKLYPLQYLLYTVALNRHLEGRDPTYRYEEQFGGVLYLFLRGLDGSSPGSGVFHDIPDPALVRELTACLIDCQGE
jgi:exodeoxyribonuclease V beta subunit